MARGRQIVSRGRTRSVKTWIGTADQGEIAVASTAKVLLSSFSFTLGLAGTVLRSRGIISVFPQSGAADLVIDGAFGMGVVSITALATGITAIPGPFTDDSWPGWFVHQYFSNVLDVTTDVGRLLLQKSYEIDSKAMRKVRNDEAVVLVAESRAGALNILSHVRVLFQES